MKNIKSKNYTYKDKFKILRKITGNLGTVGEEENKYICYVSQEKLNKSREGFRYDYCLNLYGLNDKSKKDEMLKKTYDLNKPIYYVFSNLVFENRLVLSSAFANVLIENCTFKGDIELKWNQNITFKNNKYEASNILGLGYNCYLYSGDHHIENLTFIDEKICDSKDEQTALQNFGIELKADNLNLINTTINIENPGTITIKGNNMFAKNSSISGKQVDLDYESITFEDSLIKAKRTVNIDNEKYDFSGNVIAPKVVYNNTDLSEKVGTSHVDKKRLDLKNARLLLIEELKTIKNNCQRVNDEEIEKLRKKLENKSVHKVLRKTK